MKNIIILFSLLIVACQGDHHSESRLEKDSETGIVGGKQLAPNDKTSQRVLSIRTYSNPHKVVVNGKSSVVNDVQQCTGVPLSRKLILTAAHCLTSPKNYLRTAEFKNSQGEHEAYAEEKFIKHPEYVKGNQEFDLGIIKLKKELSEDIIITPLLDHSLDSLKNILATGYGRTNGVVGDPKGDGLNRLRSVVLNVVEFSKNENRFRVDQTQGKGFCQGDSGGPAFSKIGKHVYVVGIASKTTRPGNEPVTALTDKCSLQGVYINVQKQFTAVLELVREMENM